MSIFDRKITLDEKNALKPGVLSGNVNLEASLAEDNFQTASCLDMDSKDYFDKKEAELLKLNEEINKKKNMAMKKVQEVVSDLHMRPTKDNYTRQRPTSRVGLEENTSLINIQEIAATKAEEKQKFIEKATPKEIDNLQATIRLQKTRIISLQDELLQANQNNETLVKQLEQMKQDQQKREEGLKKSEKQLKDMATSFDKASKKAGMEESRNTELQKEIKGLRLEIDMLKQGTKKLEGELSGKETRMVRMGEELDKWKSQAVELKGGAMSRASVDKQELEKVSQECKRLEKQRNELISAFKKQLRLIEVLKKQKAHIEAARLLSFTEEDYIKSLELGQRIQ